jgi:integrase
MANVFADIKLDTITTADVDRFLDGLLARRSGATRNRYRTTLHAVYNRALRHGIVTVNPVRGIARAKEPEGRTLYLAADEEAAVRGQLDPEATRSGRRTLDARRGDLRPLFTVSVNTGLRWSEQRRLEWRDVDFLTGLISVRQTKSGYARQIPMNSLVRSAMVDLGSQRSSPDDPEEPVLPLCAARQVLSEGDRTSSGGAPTGRERRDPAGWLYMALQPSHLRLAARDGGG